jgi:hypothetical protein
MPELIGRATPIARKAHYCCCCGAPAIQPGDKYHRKTYTCDGSVYDWIICAGCESIRSAVWGWASDHNGGIGLEEYAEWANDHASHPKHGKAARAYLARALNHKIRDGA